MDRLFFCPEAVCRVLRNMTDCTNKLHRYLTPCIKCVTMKVDNVSEWVALTNPVALNQRR